MTATVDTTPSALTGTRTLIRRATLAAAVLVGSLAGMSVLLMMHHFNSLPFHLSLAHESRVEGSTWFSVGDRFRELPCDNPEGICGVGPPTFGIILGVGDDEWAVELGTEGCAADSKERRCKELALPTIGTPRHFE